MANGYTQLTQRQQAIIHILAQFTVDTPATVADISKELRISSRTVLREVPEIEKWLKSQGMQLLRKPGVGMAIVGTPQQLQGLSHQRSGESGMTDRGERRRDLMARLLTAPEPMKAFVFTKTYQISEGTLSADLEYIAQVFRNHQVTLQRKSGVGMYVTGDELHLRHAMAAVVFDWMQDEAVSGLFLWRKAPVEPVKDFGLWRLIDPKTLQPIHKALIAAAQIQGIGYTDRGYLSLMVFVSVAIKRMTQGDTIQQTPPAIDMAMAQDVAKGLENVAWTDNEIGYLAVELAGDVQPPQVHGDVWDSIALRRLMLKVVAQVHQALEGTFDQEELLVSDLVRHTQEAAKRLQLGVAAKHNHAPELQTTYPAIYQATAQACTLLEDPIGLRPIPQSEVALIAMHFCAAVERAKDRGRPVQVVIACPMGMGMSRILAANLAKAYPQIVIQDVVSVRALDKAKLEMQGVDLVVSTVMVDIEFPCICVSPALLPQDKLRLAEVCNRISTTPAREQKPADGGQGLHDTIGYVTALGDGITRLLNHIPLVELPQVESKEALLKKAATIFQEADSLQLWEDLTAREAISETYIDQGQTLLLHCKTTAIDTCRFGYLRLGRSLENQGNLVDGAIVMVAPKDGSPIHVEMMGHICSAFLNNERLYLALKQGSQQELATHIQQELARFYAIALQAIQTKS